MDSGSLRLLFSQLEKLQYDWQPQTPDQLLAFRKIPESLSAVTRLFGLGADVTLRDLLIERIDPLVLEKLKLAGMLFGTPPERGNGMIHSRYSISRIPGTDGDHFVVHDHWPPVAGREKSYVHLGRESLQLSQILVDRKAEFSKASVLDLGCSSGALSLCVAKQADKVAGLDISAESIAIAQATAKAYGYGHIAFDCAAIGEEAADKLVEGSKWDAAVMNPPMVVPSKEGAYPHRDGGKLGVEKPFLFLDFCDRHLKSGGVVHTLATNPIVNGKPLFFDRLKKTGWDIEEKQRLHSRFNQSVAAQEKYHEQGIESIELWYLALVKQ